MNFTGEDTSVENLIPVKKSKFNLRKTVVLVVSSVFILSVLVGTVSFYVLKNNKNSENSENFVLNDNNVPDENIQGPICSLKDSDKFDCYPDTPVTENQCLQRGCCYKATLVQETNSSGFPPLGVPYCYYPANYVGYKVSDLKCDNDKCQASLTKVTASGFPNDVKNLLLDVTFINDNIVRVKIIDAATKRFEVPIPLNDDVKPKKDPLYSVFLTADGALTINRRSTNSPVFSTNLSRLVYAEQFLQISSSLSSPYFYGIGEQKAGVLRNVNWTRFTLFNRDREPVSNKNLYGSHPFYLVLEKDGLANGAFLYNSNAMDVILQPTPAVTFRPIGGILDLFIILGTTPQSVIQHYTSVIGRSFMPPYWSLGFQLCKFGYNSLNNTKAVYQRMKDSQIPYDVQWNDIDYMEGRKDFTYDKVKFQGLPEFVDELHKNGMHYVVMTDPGVSSSEEPGTYPPYDEGVAKDLFIKNYTGQIFEAKVWTKGFDVFPDFSHPDAESYWVDQFVRFHPEIEFDGVWIDMNEPSNMYDGQIDGCPNSTLEHPHYLPGGEEPLYSKTVCMTAKHYSTVHYNEHNLLSYREAKATVSALSKVRPDKRPFIISRASFIGQGVHSGHWSGDIYSSWEDLRYSIPSLINFNMYGMSMVGSDICGFNGNTTVELCARWQALGAFYPFSRNHNDIDAIEQDPPILGPVVVEATKKALNARYYLLPYLYTLFYRSHAFGETVARPLFFEFPTDVKTYSIDEQFLWGPALMIVPVLYPNVTIVKAYYPKGKWYNFTSGESRSSIGQEFTLSIPLTEINLEVRGGYILPLQQAATTTTESRKNDFDLFVALNDTRQASGELYWDDGDTLDTYENGIYNLVQFNAGPNSLNSTIVKSSYTTSMDLGNIKIYGVDNSPSQVKINSESVPFIFEKNNLVINAKGVPLLKSLIVTWT